MIKVVRIQVAASADDAWVEGEVWTPDVPDLVCGNVGGVSNHIWCRFLSVAVPRGATIVKAYLDYVGSETDSGSTVRTTIRAEAVDNATQVVSKADFDSRTRTTAIVDWDSVPTISINGPARSPNIAQMIREVVNRSGWAEGNALSLFHEDNGSDEEAYRYLYSYDGSPAKAPLLHIEYDDGGPGGSAIVTVHDDFPPFPMLAEFRTAHDVDRLLVHSPADKGPGQFSLSIASDDPQANRDTVRRGLVVAIRSTHAGCPPFLGRIDEIEHDPAAGTVYIGGAAYEQVLFERMLPQSCIFRDQMAGAIAMQLLRLANSRNTTGIWPSKASEPGRPVRGDFDAGSQYLGDALNKLAQTTGDEWWLEETVSRQKIEMTLRWGRKRGYDRSHEVVLWEGRHFSMATYTQSGEGVARSVVAVGGGEDLADRPAAAISMNRPTSTIGKASVSGRAQESIVRGSSVPMTLAGDKALYFPLDESEAALTRAAQKELETPANAGETLELTLVPSAPWDLKPGESFTAVLPSANFGGVRRTVRILDLQPDEATDERELAVRVEADV